NRSDPAQTRRSASSEKFDSRPDFARIRRSRYHQRMEAATTLWTLTVRTSTHRWRRFLHSRSASVLTHGSLVLLTIAEFVLLLRLPFLLAFVPCALIHPRIGVLMHEYIHGIPLARYRHNLWILSLFDGLMLMFGTLDLFRGTHLAHHRWLNTENDPAFSAE